MKKFTRVDIRHSFVADINTRKFFHGVYKADYQLLIEVKCVNLFYSQTYRFRERLFLYFVHKKILNLQVPTPTGVGVVVFILIDHTLIDHTLIDHTLIDHRSTVLIRTRGLLYRYSQWYTAG